uniref:Uncharacterized protein n=1 Tax=Solanum lycopersicum TaxID=4081 RepID=A0A3Q7J6Y3_SOLLC
MPGRSNILLFTLKDSFKRAIFSFLSLGIVPDQCYELPESNGIFVKSIITSVTIHSIGRKRHLIRGEVFYPKGKPLSLETYLDHLSQIKNSGTHRSLPYKRVLQAIARQDFSGGFQAERLTEMLEERHGGERMGEILQSLTILLVKVFERKSTGRGKTD